MALAISVVIPLAPGETAWEDLLPQLGLPEGCEIILACGEQKPETNGEDVKVIQSAPGRAQQMNAGARAAKGEVLWFLHADSKLGEGAIDHLMARLAEDSQALWFFDLRFLNDGPREMKWNERAVRWRAGVLKIPFGDQGFCLSRDLFFDLGGYREDLEYGEDHVFAWKVRQEGFEVKRVGAEIFTSARKYKKGGWLTITWMHVWKTLWQGVPQRLILLRAQIARVFS